MTIGIKVAMEVVAQIHRLYASGLTVKQISQRLQMPHSTVFKYVRPKRPPRGIQAQVGFRPQHDIPRRRRCQMLDCTAIYKGMSIFCQDHSK